METIVKEDEETSTAKVNNCLEDKKEENHNRSALPSSSQKAEPAVVCQIDKRGSYCMTHNTTAKRVYTLYRVSTKTVYTFLY